jgi:hypothetical protein
MIIVRLQERVERYNIARMAVGLGNDKAITNDTIAVGCEKR